MTAVTQQCTACPSLAAAALAACNHCGITVSSLKWLPLHLMTPQVDDAVLAAVVISKGRWDTTPNPTRFHYPSFDSGFEPALTDPGSVATKVNSSPDGDENVIVRHNAEVIPKVCLLTIRMNRRRTGVAYHPENDIEAPRIDATIAITVIISVPLTATGFRTLSASICHPLWAKIYVPFSVALLHPMSASAVGCPSTARDTLFLAPQTADHTRLIALMCLPL
jgi:hypothetical protein